MADIPRVKGNISKMIAQGAPEADIDAYLAGEGVSLDMLKVAPQVGMAEDAAKSVGAGLASATAGTLGMAGDARSLLSSGVDWAGSKLGVSPDSVQTFKDYATKAAGGAGAVLANAPTSRQIIESAPDPVVSPDYKPQTALGGYLKTGSEFAPGMLTGGPRSLLTRFGTNVAAPAIASETAGQLTEGTAAEPYARIAAALMGGAGAASAAQKFNQMATARSAAKAVPSTDDILKTASNQFKQAENMNLVVTPDWAKSAASKMRDDLKGFDPEAQAAVFRAADRLGGLASAKTPALSQTQLLELEMNGLPLPVAKSLPVAMNDAELVRKQLVTLKKSTEAPVREAARRAVDSLQESQLALGPAQTLRGDADVYTKTVKDAIGNWAAGKRSNAVSGKVDLGTLNAGTAGSGANEDNALRQAVKQLARPINNTNTPVAKRLGFNDEEIAAIKGAAMGTTAGNVARFIGKAAPTGVVSGAMSSGAGGMAGGPVGAVALPAVGYIAKKIGDLSTKKAVAALDDLVRSRSPLAAQIAGQLPPKVITQMSPKSQGLLAAMIAADPVFAQQIGGSVGQSSTNQTR